MALPTRPGQGLPINRPQVGTPAPEPVSSSHDELELPPLTFDEPADEFPAYEDDAFAHPANNRLNNYGDRVARDEERHEHRQVIENTDESRGPSRENLQRLGGTPSKDTKRPIVDEAPQARKEPRPPAPPARANKPTNRLAGHGEKRRIVPGDERNPSTRPEQAPAAQEETDERWHVDPETGKRFKEIPGYKDGVKFTKTKTKEYASNGMSFSDLRTFVSVDEDFDMDDLGGTAETFLPHLRVPPNKEEQERLRRARAAQQKEHDRAYEAAVAEESASEADEIATTLGVKKKKPWWRRKGKDD